MALTQPVLTPPTLLETIEAESAQFLGSYKKLLCCQFHENQLPFIAKMTEALKQTNSEFPDPSPWE